MVINSNWPSRYHFFFLSLQIVFIYRYMYISPWWLQRESITGHILPFVQRLEQIKVFNPLQNPCGSFLVLFDKTSQKGNPKKATWRRTTSTCTWTTCRLRRWRSVCPASPRRRRSSRAWTSPRRGARLSARRLQRKGVHSFGAFCQGLLGL